MKPSVVFHVAGLLTICAVPMAHTQTLDTSAITSLKWRAIGPAVSGGRINDIAVVERNTSIVYVGAASGGLWKSDNNGTTWEPIFDHEGVASIGDVAVTQSNPNIIWVGTGEPNNRQSSTFGDGIYKSTDAGKSWQNVGLRDTHHIGRVLPDPIDPNVVYVAALGHLWGPNKERGVFRTNDGGKTWTHALALNEDTGAVDIAMHPGNRQILYAAAYQRRRTAWGFNGGGAHGGVYKTADGGRTWRKLAGGLPAGIVGRIGLDVCRSKPNVVYAIVEHRNGGVFRSDNNGETWRKVNDLNPRPMYYSQIRCDPNDDRRIYVLGTGFFVSQDEGQTFADPKTGVRGENTSMKPRFDVGVHVDHHALWINPANSNHLVLGNDGGVWFSYDGSINWAKIDTLPVSQFYAIGVDSRKPYNVYGGLQDTHAWGGPSATRNYSGITNADWYQVGFGDGMYAQIDPTDRDTLYVEQNDGNLVRFNLVTGDRKNIEPVAPAGEPPYRFNWTAPLQVSPHEPRRLYLGGNRLFVSPDRGETWTATPDLTRAENRDALTIMGTASSEDVLSRNDGVSAWGTITTLAESPIAPGVLWVGTDDGKLQISRDGGQSWTKIVDGVGGLPSRAYVSRVEPSHSAVATAYASFDRHRDDDFAPYIFRTTDFGQSWTSVASNLPKVGWVNVVKEHPNNPKLLFAGTETGAFASIDGGSHWTKLPGLPTVPVDDLVVHPRDNDLILGTHGRSIYILDDISPISGLTEAVLAADAHLFEIRPATIFVLWKRDTYSGQQYFAGPNPPFGALINYYLKTPPAYGAKITILDAAGQTVRELTGTVEAGINRIAWDLRWAAPQALRRADPTARGPFVLPGTYTVRLSTGGREFTHPVRVDADPDLQMSDAERIARFTFLQRLNELRAAMAEGDAEAAALASEVAAVLKRQPTIALPTDIAAAAVALGRKVDKVRGTLGGQRSGFAGRGGLQNQADRLFAQIDGETDEVRQGSLTGPTEAQRQSFDRIAREFQAVLSELEALSIKSLPSFYDETKKLQERH